MPNENENGNSRKWPDRSILLGILAAIMGDGYVSWSSSDSLAESLSQEIAEIAERSVRTEQQIIGHRLRHPDADLTVRIDRHLARDDARHDSLEERVRELERHEHERE